MIFFFSLSKQKSIVIATEIELHCQVTIPGYCDQQGVLESSINLGCFSIVGSKLCWPALKSSCDAQLYSSTNDVLSTV